MTARRRILRAGTAAPAGTPHALDCECSACRGRLRRRKSRTGRPSPEPAARPGTPRTAPPLYTHPDRPGQLIARERRWWVIWPATPGGWALRRPYEALDADVPLGAVPAPLTAAWGTGWRHAQRPAHVPPKGPVPTIGGAQDRRPITVHVPSAILDAIDRARGDATRSAWARAALERALQTPLP